MTPSSVFLYSALFGLGYLVAPTTLLWGWIRWIKQRPPSWTIASTTSFAGFLASTLSALLGLSMMVFAAEGGFLATPENNGPDYGLFYKFVRWGVALSVLGLAFSLGGVWRRGAVRWHAPATAVGTLAFWLVATTWP